MAIIKFTDKLGNTHDVEEDQAVYRKAVYGYGKFDNKILLVKDARVGRWELPGGGVDPGENDEQALIREFEEETGLKGIKIIRLIKNELSNYYSLGEEQAWKSDRNFYEIEIPNLGGLTPEGNGEDTRGAALFTLEQLKNLHIAAADLEIINLMNNLH